jgi:tyrosyl-tRNA synthetase
MINSEFLQEATERGFVFQCTDTEGLDAALRAGTVTAYIGFDCTADSLHVGSLVQIMILRLLQRHGHRPLVLMGGGTTRIGDPSGKDETRQLLTSEQIAANMAGIRRCFDPFLHFGDGPADALTANNDDWLSALGYIPLLREVGTHFTVNRMLSFDSVRIRLDREHPLTFLEFNYMILQSYDFRELNRRYGCTLQIGGSDQWGNIVCGIDLTRRTDNKTVYGLTTPLIATASGAKMGKSVQGAVWLTRDRLSPYEYWQFWRNTEDADVGRFMRLFTDLPLSEIARLEALGGTEVNEAKKVLATEATSLAHGRAAADEASQSAAVMFASAHVHGEATLTADAYVLPGVEVPRSDIAAGIPAFRLFVLAGLAGSNGEARRLIRGGGARINDMPVKSEGQTVTVGDLHDDAIKLSAGRKHHRLVRVP